MGYLLHWTYYILWFDHFLHSRAEICQFLFFLFFGKFKTSKRHSEINWPLDYLLKIMGMRTKFQCNPQQIFQESFYKFEKVSLDLNVFYAWLFRVIRSFLDFFFPFPLLFFAHFWETNYFYLNDFGNNLLIAIFSPTDDFSLGRLRQIIKVVGARSLVWMNENNKYSMF